MEASSAEETADPAPRKRGGGRVARREQRAHGPQGLGRPYILRNIPTYDILGEDAWGIATGTAGPLVGYLDVGALTDPERSR